MGTRDPFSTDGGVGLPDPKCIAESARLASLVNVAERELGLGQQKKLYAETAKAAARRSFYPWPVFAGFYPLAGDLFAGSESFFFELLPVQMVGPAGAHSA